MHPHVPLGSLGSPGLPVPYDQLGSRRRADPPWPPETPTAGGPRPRSGHRVRLRVGLRLRHLVRPAVGTS